MGIVYHRPVNGVDYGDGSPVTGSGSGYVLGDGTDNSYKRYMSTSESGTILVFPAYTGAGIPAGREIIAVCAGHRERQTNYLLGADNGWPMTYLRVGGKRQTQIRAYHQDGSSNTWRQKLSAPLYKRGYSAWSNAEISTMSTDTGIASGEYGPARNRMWCRASESFLALIYDEPIPTPTLVSPNATTSTVSVTLEATIRAPQEQQPVRPVWELARNAGFTEDVREFFGDYTARTVASRVIRHSNQRDASYTNLAPGLWHIRVRAQDIRGDGHESPWFVGTPFEIRLNPPPRAEMINPGAIVPTPYGSRAAKLGFTGNAPGGRAIGIEWEFSHHGYDTVNWINTEDAMLYVDADLPIRYIADPDPGVRPGLNGGRVGVADPSQYLTQHIDPWIARARGIDRFGISGEWSEPTSFLVSHPPVTLSASPAHGAPLDATRGVLSWVFGDPWAGDRQSYAQVTLRRTNVLNHSTTVTGPSASVIPGLMVNLQAHLRAVVYYDIVVADRDGVWSSPALQGTFLVSKEPEVTILSPGPGEFIQTGNPEFTWSAVFAAPELSQRSAQVVIRRVDNGLTVFTGDADPGTAERVLKGSAPLDNLTDYIASVTVVDTEGLAGRSTVQFSTSYVRPAGVSSYPVADEYLSHGYVVVRFDSSDIDAEFAEWRIYRRRVDPAGEWVLAGTVQDPFAESFKDWLVAGTGEWEYTVTQAVTRFGSSVESLRDEFPNSVSIFSDSYWLIVPGAEEQSVQLHTVTADDYTSERETAEYVIIDGGRRRNMGTRKGKAGALGATVRHSTQATASQQVQLLEDLNRDSRPVIMRDPFGNLTQVSLGEIAVSRIAGVGSSEFSDLTIPYYEVM